MKYLSSDEKHERGCSTDNGQLPPIQPCTHRECGQKSDLRKDFCGRTETCAYARVRDFADVNLRGNLNDGGEESGQKGRRVNQFDAVGEQGQRPRKAERHGDEEERPSTTLLDDNAGTKASEQGPEEGKTRDPRSLLLCDGQCFGGSDGVVEISPIHEVIVS